MMILRYFIVRLTNKETSQYPGIFSNVAGSEAGIAAVLLERGLKLYRAGIPVDHCIFYNNYKVGNE